MSDMMQKDLVLAPNEFAFVLDETKGNVSCNVGPHKMSLSQSDRLVRFDIDSKRFIACERQRDAIQTLITAPEGWYVALKNPAPGNTHPKAGVSNTIPDGMLTGCKIMIPGPVDFALYPGQMAEVIKGHSLRSNQYLIARVYDADALNSSEKIDPEDPDNKYFNGQILVIKGTETSFYIPPTGVEVKAIDSNSAKGYVRDAVTLERLEYCILKDENGTKRYVHGPEVVFPEPTEVFLAAPHTGEIKRRAIELSDISGVYIKVIADYTDEDGTKHKTGEELFITGKQQMIYYPRPEHTFITYEGRIIHHAIAIPKGEGRYIMNRMTGEIKTVRGPAMYLPDPRVEVVVKRTLTKTQCELWYPGNTEVLVANGHQGLTLNCDYNVARGLTKSFDFDVTAASYTPTGKETVTGIDRKSTYTGPRTISLDSSKFDGAVAVNVWTGYAINVVSKDGVREIICGPQTVLLDYDQILETLQVSTGKPKTADSLQDIVFLRHENNQVSDVINVETEDFVTAAIKVSYHVSFDSSMKEKWFSVDNYVKHLCDWGRNVIKKAAKELTVAKLYESYQDVVVNAIRGASFDSDTLYLFEENGMYISDVEVLSLHIEPAVRELIDQHQKKVVSKTLELVAAKNSALIEEQIVALNREKVILAEAYAQFKAEKESETVLKDLRLAMEQDRLEEEVATKKAAAEKAQQVLENERQELIRADREKDGALALSLKERECDLDAKREAETAKAMKEVFGAIGPDLAAAMNNSNNQEIMKGIVEAISPYAIANGESVSNAINKVLRGTSLESLFDKFMEHR